MAFDCFPPWAPEPLRRPPAPSVGMREALGLHFCTLLLPGKGTGKESLHSAEQKPCAIITINQIVNIFQKGFSPYLLS